MSKDNRGEQEMLECLKQGMNENAILEWIYRQNFASVANMLKAYGQQPDDIKDVFQEAVIIFYENVKRDKFRRESSISTYIHAIARRRMLKRLRDEGKMNTVSMDEEDLLKSTPVEDDFWMIQYGQEKRLERLLLGLKEDCLKVLTYFYYEHLSMKEISMRMKFKNEQIARNKKSKCLTYLRRLWNQTPNLD